MRLQLLVFRKKALIFYRSVFRCTVLKTFLFLFIWGSIHSIGIFFFAEIKYVDLVAISNKRMEEAFTASLQNCKNCVCIKYLRLGQPLKLIAVNFTILYSMQNAQNFNFTKNLFISQFFEQIKLCLSCFLFKSFFHLKKCLCHVYVNAMALTWTVNLACSRFSWPFS